MNSNINTAGRMIILVSGCMLNTWSDVHNFDTTDILTANSFLGTGMGGVLSLHCRRLSDLPSLHLLDTNRVTPMLSKSVSRHCQISPVNKITSSWEPLIYLSTLCVSTTYLLSVSRARTRNTIFSSLFFYVAISWSIHWRYFTLNLLSPNCLQTPCFHISQ